METQFWDVLAEHPFFVIVIIFGGILAATAILVAIDKLHVLLGFKTRGELYQQERKQEDQKRDKQRKEMWDEIKAMRDETRRGFEKTEAQNKELEKQVIGLKEANIMILGDRLTQKTKYYLRTGYIPAEEMTEYRALYDSYKNMGGNHGVDDLVEKTIETLPLQPSDN